MNIIVKYTIANIKAFLGTARDFKNAFTVRHGQIYIIWRTKNTSINNICIYNIFVKHN